MSESKNICLYCGLCCNGTLIGFVELDGGEISVFRELMDIEEMDEKGLFFHPCINYGCNGCTIYSKRPKQCGKFKCKLLKSIENNELDFESATEVVNLVKQKRTAIEKQFETLPFEFKSRSFYFKILELNKLLRNDEYRLSFQQNHMDLISDLREIDKLVSKSFGISFD